MCIFVVIINGRKVVSNFIIKNFILLYKNKIMVVKIVLMLYFKGFKIVRVIGIVIVKDIIGIKKVWIGFGEYLLKIFFIVVKKDIYKIVGKICVL